MIACYGESRNVHDILLSNGKVSGTSVLEITVISAIKIVVRWKTFSTICCILKFIYKQHQKKYIPKKGKKDLKHVHYHVADVSGICESEGETQKKNIINN